MVLQACDDDLNIPSKENEKMRGGGNSEEQKENSAPIQS